MNLTENQKTAIYEHSVPMIVSASAGSGKTFAMVQRAISILENEEAKLSELLIVTFTNASALEMKQRLYDAIKNSDNPKVSHQLEDFPLADISSIDSFCQKIIKKYFFELNISPNFNVIDEVEAKYLKMTALNQIYKELQQTQNLDFKKLVDALTQKRNWNELSRYIFSISNFANTISDKEKFYNSVSLSSYTCDLENNKCLEYVLHKFDEFIDLSIESFSEQQFLLDEDRDIFNPILEQNIITLRNYLSLKLTDKILQLSNLPNSLIIPDKRPLKTESQRETQEKIKSVVDKFKKKCEEFSSVTENGNIEKIKEKLVKAKEIAEIFIKIVILFEKRYEKIKKDKFLLDFSDLERKAYEILRNEKISDIIAKNYKFIFIDEFQDTNELQFNIFQILSKYATPFYVGDPKQCIYNFRNSTPEILLNILNDYKQNGKNKMAIKFVENFRSDKSILDFVNLIFDKIMTTKTVDIDYASDGKFETSNAPKFKNAIIPNVSIGIVQKSEKEKPEQPSNEVYSVLKAQSENINLSTRTDYTDLIALYIKSFFDSHSQIYDKSIDAYRDINFSDFAILVRARSSYDKIVSKLLSYGFPVSANLEINLFDSLEVQILHNFLIVLQNSYDDVAFANFLLSPIGKLSENQLFKIRQKFPSEKYFYDACRLYENEDDDISKRLKQIDNELAEFRIKIQAQNVASILNEVINSYNLEPLWLSYPNGKDRMNRVNLFISILRNKSFNSILSEYLNFTNLYQDAFNVKYSTVSSDKSITIMTIHNSKGIEFPVTILADCGKPFGKSIYNTIVADANFGIALDAYYIDERLELPLFIKKAILLQKKEAQLKEEMRLLYVALTRAKFFLGIFGDYDLEKRKNLLLDRTFEKNTYFDWLLQALYEKIDFYSRDNQAITDNTNLTIFNSDKNDIIDAKQNKSITPKSYNENLSKMLINAYTYEYTYKKSTKINIKNSVSKLLSTFSARSDIVNSENEFIDKTTFNNSLLEASERGTAYHSVMEMLDFKSNNLNKQINIIKSNLPTKILDYVDFNDIEKAFNTIIEFVTPNSNIYKEKKFMLYVPYNSVFVDSDVNDKILIQGIIDIFIEQPNEIILIDYKTNFIKNEKNLIDKYLMQLNLYKRALELQYNKKVKSYIYSFALSKLIEVE